jgi:hypothetical protein
MLLSHQNFMMFINKSIVQVMLVGILMTLVYHQHLHLCCYLVLLHVVFHQKSASELMMIASLIYIHTSLHTGLHVLYW